MLEINGRPDRVHIETDDGWFVAALGEGGAWHAAGAEVALRPLDAEDRWDVRLSVPAAAVRAVRLRWERRLTEPLSVLGDHWERGYGDLEWRGLAPERAMPWYFLAQGADRRVVGIGVKTGPAAFCCWQLDAEGLTLTLDTRCGDAGVRLGTRALSVCTIVRLAGGPEESAFAAARRLCAALCDRPLLPAQPVYGGNNWYYAYGNSSHQSMLADSEFIASLAPTQTNRPFMVVDDGWQRSSGGGSCKGGPWVGNAAFPDMPRLAEEMKLAGVRPGLWFRPLLTSESVPGSWIRTSSPSLGHVLDPSVPDVLAYIREAVASMTGWGFELLKHDFSSFDLLGLWGFEMRTAPHRKALPFADRSRTTAEIVLSLYRAIAEASGDALILGCNTFSHLAAGLVHVQRTGDDTSGKNWERTRYMGINTLAFRMAQHHTFYSHDADCIGITDNVPWRLNRQWLQLLASSGTPLFVSADPAVITEEHRRALVDAFALAAEPAAPAEPLDWLYSTCPNEWQSAHGKLSFQWHEDEPSSAPDDNLWWK